MIFLSAPPLCPSTPNRAPIRSNSLPINSRHHHRQRVSLPGPTAAEEGPAGGAAPISPPSAAAVAAAIRRASPGSSVDFTRRVERPGSNGGGLVLPSPDFRKLCLEQLHLFRMVVRDDAHLSVFVRPAGSYVMDQLELRRVITYPGTNMSESTDYIIVVGNFATPGGLRAAEAALLNQQVEFVTECDALVFPMVKHPFVVGFLVAELPKIEMETCESTPSEERRLPFSPLKDRANGSSQCADKTLEIQAFKVDSDGSCAQFTTEQSSRAVLISRSLAMAYVMDQKAMLLQQSSWQNNIRMSHLVEQIHSSLSSIRALGNMLSVQVKRSEIPYDILEGILVQGDHMKDVLQQLQDAVYLTKANIVQYNEDTLRRMHDSVNNNSESLRSLPFDYATTERENYNARTKDSLPPLGSERKDMEMPMPPLLLAPVQQHDIRPCTVSDVLNDLVGAAVPLANKQQRFLHLCEDPRPLQVAVEESVLRQALSNLIEGALLRTQIGGRVEICAAPAPAGGGGLIIIDDNGPDMHYLAQMHSLTPFGADLFSDVRVNFVAGLAVAREILEEYGCVVRVISPRTLGAALGAGGTRVELWLPSARSGSADRGEET
ncbi:putative chloroplast sensor kinase, chloroplastic isoform X1 [Iris pallida]|uniref:Chloroplast sensor kinase, chloroplastic isoform X1 n=1 Tax=Iris pallida TaxID=29817 RepID=A0AAX6EE21_IRIPA|nr:putative chloroplast sensor kinase, chloroplastic isoform X1 [Iris pallida]